MQIRTPDSGVNSADQEFAFIITPVLGGARLESMKYNRSNYTSGRFESIVVSGLMGGTTYTFSAIAINVFGESESADSLPITAGMLTYGGCFSQIPCILSFCLLAEQAITLTSTPPIVTVQGESDFYGLYVSPHICYYIISISIFLSFTFGRMHPLSLTARHC